MNLNVTEAAAYLGAAAWLPPLLRIFWHYLSKPTISIYPSNHGWVGFTSIGPVFNLNLAFLSEKKDGVISSISLRFKHEGGSETVFECSSSEEISKEIASVQGERYLTTRSTSPLMLVLKKDEPRQALYKFQKRDIYNHLHPYLLKLLQRIRRKQEKTEKWDANALQRDATFLGYMEFIRNQFFWKVGRYDVSFEATSPKASKLLYHPFVLHLNQDDIDILNGNVEVIKEELSYYFPFGDIHPSTDLRWQSILCKLEKSESLIRCA